MSDAAIGYLDRRRSLRRTERRRADLRPGLACSGAAAAIRDPVHGMSAIYFLRPACCRDRGSTFYSEGVIGGAVTFTSGRPTLDWSRRRALGRPQRDGHLNNNPDGSDGLPHFLSPGSDRVSVGRDELSPEGCTRSPIGPVPVSADPPGLFATEPVAPSELSPAVSVAIPAVVSRLPAGGSRHRRQRIIRSDGAISSLLRAGNDGFSAIEKPR